jgi:hypothetical protein
MFCPGARIIALTSSGRTVIEAAEILNARGYGRSKMHVLEHMGGPDERITVMRADRIAAEKPHSPISTRLRSNAGRTRCGGAGIGSGIAGRGVSSMTGN